MRKWLLVLLILVIAMPIAAQETPEPGRGWRAWLYDSNVGAVTVVNQSGDVVREFTLPLPQAFNFYGQNIAVSPSGTHVLYTALDTSATIPNQQVFVYDIEAGFIAVAYPLNAGAQATTLDVRPTPAMFDEAARRVAFGYVISSEESTGWNVVVLDYNSGVAEATLNTETEATELILPVIRNFDGTTVAFTAVYYGAGGAAAYPSYLWDISTDTVTETQIYSSIQADRDAETGEVIATAYLEAMSAAPLPEQPGFTIPQNVATVYQPQSGTRHVFYNDAERVIDNIRFVQDGERVAISRYDAQTDTPGTWQIIDRDGTVVGDLQIPTSVFNVFGTPDGLVYLDLGQGATLVHVDTTDDSLNQEVIWTGDMQSFPVLAAVQADVVITAEEAEPLDEWVELTEPEPIE